MWAAGEWADGSSERSRPISRSAAVHLRHLIAGRGRFRHAPFFWNAQGGPFKDALNNSPKYLASTTLEEPLPWPNSTLLRGDIVATLRSLKEQSGGVLAIMGSGS